MTYVGQFYQEKSHLIPNEILIPQDIDEEAVKALVDTKVLKPQRGEKKQLVNLAIKNARVSLEQKFNLLEKSMEKTQGAIENLGKLLQIPTPVRIESFDNSNIMGTSPVSAMVVFVNGKPSKKRTTASTRSRPSSDQMTMPACGRSFADVTAVSCGMA